MEEGYKSCPHCAEPIRIEAKYCKHCHRKLPQPTPVLRWVLYSILGAAALSFFLYNVVRSPEIDRQNQRLVQEMATVPFEKKQWNEISRTLVQSTAIDLRGNSGWLVDPIYRPNGNVKVFLLPQCAASEPDRVFFAIMDEQNFERMQGGYPPVLLASDPVGAATEVEVPYGRRFWYGFVEVASKPNAPGTIPTSELGFAIYLLNEFQKRNHPPIRLTAEIYSSVRLYATPTDARREVLALKQKLSQPSDSTPLTAQSQSSNPQENEARTVGNEASVVRALRTIDTAEVTFATKYNLGYAAGLEALVLVSSDIKTVLGEANRSGYVFTYTPTTPNGSIDGYTLRADPVTPGTTSANHYFTDQSGVIRVERDKQADSSSPPIP